MSVRTIHRLYTEQKSEKAIVRLISERFENFTLQPVTGYYAGQSEKSILVEIAGATPSAISKLAARIKKMNGQKSILTIRFKAHVETVRW